MASVADDRARMERDLLRSAGRCIADYSLIEPGDRIMVCLSGGKDSYTMLQLLGRLQRRAPVSFELLAVHLDQGQPGYDGAPLEAWLASEGYAYRILREDTYSVVLRNVPEGRTYCSVCSRLRRGVLYNAAEALGCTKIALGHHRDDAIETLMLNLMYTGTLAAMPPKLVSDDRRNVVIRPLLLCAEEAIARYAAACAFPVLPCNLCSSQDNLKRKQVKRVLSELEALSPRLRQSMLAAITRVRPSQLGDVDLWRALSLPVSGLGDGQAGGLGGDQGRARVAPSGAAVGPEEDELAAASEGTAFSLSYRRKRLPLLAE
ncbi:MAG: tRNA 2-thiocytidine(32) synthetase TtcA [Myxococcales bacterium]|nr:tRNA 2-thiocytidine(32) synthetase TtcA [Myxococcales bacterium]MDD9968632.1 tRNA 2-thiocytidine(32) synthetase TtcA [Myxococcales bacterium]